MRLACRWSVVCLCGLLPVRAGAQTLFPPTIATPAAPTPPVAAPAPPPPADVPQPGGDEPFVGEPKADPATSLILDNADSLVSGEGNTYTLRGHVRMRYKGYTLTSDEADVDLDRRSAIFSGNVFLKAPGGQTVNGGPLGTLALNLRRSTYRLTGGRTVIPPQDLSLGIILPVYVYGGVISGRPGFIDARGSQFTTCDFADPHYSFGAKQLYIVPGSHLVGKYVTYFRDGHREFTIPYLYVPLDRRIEQSQIIPQVGYDPPDGYFAKVALGYALAASLPGLLRLDEFQKRGLGTGFDQAYGDTSHPGRGFGTFQGYHLSDKSTGIENVTYGLNDQRRVGTVQVALTTQGQSNSYYVSQSKSRAQNTQLNLTRSVGAFNTSLQTNLTQNDYGQGLSQTLTSTLDNVYQSSRSRLETKFDYSGLTTPSFGFAGSNNNQQRLNSNLDFTNQGRLFDLEVLGNKFSTLSGVSSPGYGGLERLPELRLATDAGRLTLLRRLLLLPAATRLNLSLGDFNEPSSLTRTQRAFFGADLGDTTKSIGRSTFDYGGIFQQAFYGDDTAQYTLNGRAGYRLRIGGKSDFSANYTYLRPYGFTPFQFDFVGNTNNAALNFGYQETRQFQLTMATAFDFNQTHRLFPGASPAPWQNLSAQLLFTPGSLFQLRSTAAYDINHGKLLDLTSFARLRVHGGQALDLATRYDPVTHRFSQTNYRLDLPFLRDRNPAEDSGYRVQAIGGYNGLTSQFTYKGVALTRSWHDFEASLVFQDDLTSSLRSGQTVTFNFRLKAFPAFEPFTIGQFGQGLDPGLGAVY